MEPKKFESLYSDTILVIGTQIRRYIFWYRVWREILYPTTNSNSFQRTSMKIIFDKMIKSNLTSFLWKLKKQIGDFLGIEVLKGFSETNLILNRLGLNFLERTKRKKEIKKGILKMNIMIFWTNHHIQKRFYDCPNSCLILIPNLQISFTDFLCLHFLCIYKSKKRRGRGTRGSTDPLSVIWYQI